MGLCVCWVQPAPPALLEAKEVALMTRLQARVRDLERLKARLRLELDRRDFSAEICAGGGAFAEHAEMDIYDAYRVSWIQWHNPNSHTPSSQVIKTHHLRLAFVSTCAVHLID